MTINDLFFVYLLLLIFSLSFLRKNNSISDYLITRKKIGLNEGTLLLLSHLLKGYLFLILFQVISKQMIFWIIGFCFVLILVTTYFQKWIHHLMTDHLSNPNHTPLTFFKERSTRSAYNSLLIVMALIAFFSFISELTWITLIVSEAFQIPIIVILIALIFLVYVYSVMGGYGAISKISRVLIVFAFGTVACLLLYIYLTNGIKTVYQVWTVQQNHLHQKLFSNILEQIMWFLIMIFIYLGYMLTNISLWHLNFSMKANRIKSIYRNAIFCFTSLVTALLFIGVFTQSIAVIPPYPFNSVLHILSNYTDLAMTFLISALLSIGLISLMVSMKAIMDAAFLILPEQKHPGIAFFKNVHLATLSVLLLLCFTLRPSYSTLLASIKLFSILCIVSIPCFLLLILSKKKITMLTLTPLLIGFLTGFCLIIVHTPLLISIMSCLILSGCLQCIIWLCQLLLHK
ncbi:hypothetical protein C0674_02695 [Sporolactobacillus terrae]|uniref:Uncharacterized protein n=2 Tax=Sporolactobacillus terrae TaxID=269673 RepID=A0ABX5Q4S7_9BACL|nr:hypothetical protein C0674_02695 [Sporolactobacillus terrae]QAA24586.1 hypothetical protein C0679_02675 [Sporolactobacillus terrae]